ncbi:YqaJ viral recombinase family protein [Mycobacterium sp. 23]|uniref:YqaJ viral recombinase family protein n=1 Tax=Mycobacterium sp. 23 TaxID=3400424 RepID=UPI003AB03B61
MTGFRPGEHVWWKTTESSVLRGTVREAAERPGVQPDGETDLLYLDAEQLHRAFTPGVYRPGQPGYIEPGTPDWLQAITPSKVAAILGVSRWESPYRLWHRMKGLVDPEPPKDIFDIGHDFEPAAANRWRRHNPGWRLSPGEVQFVDYPAGYPTVCTLDRRAVRGRGRRVVEFKTARHLEEWGDDFTGECPEDYAAQCMAQMMFTGWLTNPAHLLVLGPYFNDHIYTIDYDPEVAEWIWSKCGEFHESLAGDEPPDLDDSVATYECVRQLHPDIDGSTAEIDPDLAMAVHNANDDHKASEARLRGLKTRLLDQMGNAQHAVSGQLKVATRSTHARGGVALNLARKHPAIQAQEMRSKTA